MSTHADLVQRLPDEIAQMVRDWTWRVEHGEDCAVALDAVACAALAAVSPQPCQNCAALRDALTAAKFFIQNGVALGYIRMPDADCPDPAHQTLPKILKALAQSQPDGQAPTHED